MEYSQTGKVPRYPTLIVLVALWVIGILSIFAGMILSLVNTRAKQEFERYVSLLYITDKRHADDMEEAGGTASLGRGGVWRGWNE